MVESFSFMPLYNMSRFVSLFRYRNDLIQTQSIINSYIQGTTLSKFKDFLYLIYKIVSSWLISMIISIKNLHGISSYRVSMRISMINIHESLHEKLQYDLPKMISIKYNNKEVFSPYDSNQERAPSPRYNMLSILHLG